jgi:hypothetical protein
LSKFSRLTGCDNRLRMYSSCPALSAVQCQPRSKGGSLVKGLWHDCDGNYYAAGRGCIFCCWYSCGVTVPGMKYETVHAGVDGFVRNHIRIHN